MSSRAARFILFAYCIVTACALVGASGHAARNEYFGKGLTRNLLIGFRDYLNSYVLWLAGIILALALLRALWVPVRRWFAGRYLSVTVRRGAELQSFALALGIILLVMGILAILVSGNLPWYTFKMRQALQAVPLFNKSSIGKLVQTRRVYLAGLSLAVCVVAFTASLGLLTYVLARPRWNDRVFAYLLRNTLPRSLRYAALASALALVLSNAVASFVSGAPPANSPNVVLISIDTVRADHLQPYGSARDTAPNIRELAERGVTFMNARSQAPWTLASMATVHTGLYPSSHGAIAHDARIKEKELLIAEELREKGYTTMAVVSHQFVSRTHGFDQGFDVMDQSGLIGETGSSSETLTRSALAHLERHKGSPFFLWVHYFDPHFDYIYHPEFDYTAGYQGILPRTLKINYLGSVRERLSAEDWKYVQDIYDGEISFTDKQIGLILKALDQWGLAASTTVIITADHGEAFLEHGSVGHGREVYDELIHVPLVIYDPRSPSLAGARVTEPVETRSIARTIIDMCGVRSSPIGGIDLLGVARKELVAGPVFSEGSVAWSDKGRRTAVIDQGLKLIHDLDEDTYELYDLKDDPGENKDRLKTSGATAAALFQSLMTQVKSHELHDPTIIERSVLTEEERKRLQSLGYIK